MNNLVFLGTGGDISVIGRQLRGSGGVVIQSGETQLHIDPGPGALVRAKEFGVNVRATTAVIVTNPHFFFSNDVRAVIDAMTLSGLDKHGVLLGEKATLDALSDQTKSNVEKVLLFEPEKRMGVEDVEIKAIPAKEGTSSLLLSLPGVTIGYTGHTTYSAGLAKSLADSNVLIVNVLMPGDKREGNHLNRVDALKLIEKVQPQLAILTGFGLEMLKADPLEEARSIQRATKVQTITAHDGLRVTPSNYDAKNRQKRLSVFTKEESAHSQENNQQTKTA